MRPGRSIEWMMAAALLAAWIGGAPALAANGSPPVAGTVTSVIGDVTAVAPGKAPRSLACGDKVFSGERVVTGPGSRAGLLSGDILVQLDPDSTLLMKLTPDDTADLDLEAGRVRTVDPRQQGAPGRLSVLGTSGSLIATDTEGYLFSEKVGRYAMLCEWDAPLAVTRPGQSLTAKPRECVVSKPREPMYTTPAHDARIALADPDVCPLPPVAAGPLHFTPTDVAAGPPALFSPPLPQPPVPVDRSPCDDPGSGCNATTPVQNIVVEQAPVFVPPFP